jgi:3'-5' exoribonuclease
LIKHIAQNQARDGKAYLNVILADATGDLEARIWSSLEDLAEPIVKGDYVQAKGKLNLFQGRKQFIIQKIFKLASDGVDES